MSSKQFLELLLNNVGHTKEISLLARKMTSKSDHTYTNVVSFAKCILWWSVNVHNFIV